MIIIVENAKEFLKIPKIKNDYSAFSVYKANIQKSFGFLYTNNEQLEFEIKTYYLH